jgi:hypothetical protein
LLVALLGVAALLWEVVPSALPTHTHTSHPAAYLFLSSNTEEGLSLAESLKRLESSQQASARKLAHRILRDLNLGHGKVTDTIGDWDGSTENSLLVEMAEGNHANELRCAVAWFGLVAQQKAVLAFRVAPGKKERLHILHHPGDLAKTRDSLDREGLRDRTILPQKGHCLVLIVCKEPKTQAAMGRIARMVKGTLHTREGEIISLMAQTRNEARDHYTRVLAECRIAIDGSD